MNEIRIQSPQLLAVHPVLMTADVKQSIEFFRALGFAAAFMDDQENPMYVGLRRDGVELHLQWNDLGQVRENEDRPVYRFVARDVDELHREFSARAPSALAVPGTTPWAAPADTPWGTREFHLRDPSGNGLQFYQPAPVPGDA